VITSVHVGNSMTRSTRLNTLLDLSIHSRKQSCRKTIW